MELETTRGPVDEADLLAEPVLVDDEKWYARGTLYRFPDGEKAAFSGVSFDKKNPFADAQTEGEIEIEENGVRLMVDAATLERKVVVSVDDEREFTCAVEYRRQGSDVIVKRSVAVQLKTVPGLDAEQGRIS
jgi:hypothetical protein